MECSVKRAELLDGLTASSPSPTTKNATSLHAYESSVVIFKLAVYKDVVNTFRKLRRFGISCKIHNRLRIEYGNVSIEARLEEATIG